MMPNITCLDFQLGQPDMGYDTTSAKHGLAINPAYLEGYRDTAIDIR